VACTLPAALALQTSIWLPTARAQDADKQLGAVYFDTSCNETAQSGSGADRRELAVARQVLAQNLGYAA
jgi:hypothetical protein